MTDLSRISAQSATLVFQIHLSINFLLGPEGGYLLRPLAPCPIFPFNYSPLHTSLSGGLVRTLVLTQGIAQDVLNSSSFPAMQVLIPRPTFPSFSLALSSYRQGADETPPPQSRESTINEGASSSESSQSEERSPDLMKTFDSRCPNYWLDHAEEDKSEIDTIFEEREEKVGGAPTSVPTTGAEVRPTARNKGVKGRWLKLMVSISYPQLFTPVL
ncbi:hypothetical protein BJ165DRAFT_1410573 [Panaeolus papilionaceus]|nr:hypothetical protein BJ165DRAFT_1410573 [Panaeolus papilionaceus]